MSERVIAIDPGERVGWAHGVMYAHGEARHPDQVDPDPGCELTGHGITPLKDFAMKFHEVAGKYDTVIFEPYRIAAGKFKAHVGSDVPTLQLVGMIRLSCWLNPKVKVVSSGPGNKATGRKYAAAHLPEISQIIEAALATDHDSGHDGDAVMHLVNYFFKEYV